MKPIAVTVLATDPVTREGTVARLAAAPELEVVESGACEVLLVVATEVTERLLVEVERRRVTPDCRVVLVADAVRRQQVLRAVNLGLAALLVRQETRFDDIIEAVVRVSEGHVQLPEPVVRLLVDRLRALENASGSFHLAGRELDVLRLLSEGFDTGEVAAKLNYSERMVKHIIQGTLTRLNVRNRAHAVAQAFRSGVL
jgi:DNA-binding NarL/FixJ family response regulator